MLSSVVRVNGVALHGNGTAAAMALPPALRETRLSDAAVGRRDVLSIGRPSNYGRRLPARRRRGDGGSGVSRSPHTIRTSAFARKRIRQLPCVVASAFYRRLSAHELQSRLRVRRRRVVAPTPYTAKMYSISVARALSSSSSRFTSLLPFPVKRHPAQQHHHHRNIIFIIPARAFLLIPHIYRIYRIYLSIYI